MEGIEIQIRLVTALQKCASVQLPSAFDFFGRRFVTKTPLEVDARLGDTTSFAARFLALLRCEGSEEVLEIPIAAVFPMKLAVATQQPIRICAQARQIRRIRKQDMRCLKV